MAASQKICLAAKRCMSDKLSGFRASHRKLIGPGALYDRCASGADVGGDSIAAPLRHPTFRRIWLASVLSNLGILIQESAPHGP